MLLTLRSACVKITPHFGKNAGEMSERFKELVLKTSDVGNGTVGSNPTLSATSHPNEPAWRSTQVAEGAPLLRE